MALASIGSAALVIGILVTIARPSRLGVIIAAGGITLMVIGFSR